MERKNKTAETTDVAFKFILYPNKEQQEQITKTLGCCRYVYNRGLNQRMEKYKESKETIGYQRQQNELPSLKKETDTQWLSEVDSTALQNALRDLQNAFDHFFDGIRSGKKTGYPKFKSKHAPCASYRSNNNNNSIRVIDHRHIQLPKLGVVKCKLSKEIKGRILNATVIRNADETYEVSIMYENEIPTEVPKTGAAVGIDLGLTSLAVTSDGEIFDPPKSYQNNEKKLRRLQRKLSRKPKGSNNREKARKKVAKLHRRIRNQRKDAIHKMTRSLVNRYDVICMEQLKVNEMLKNRYLSQGISDASFGEIRRQLEYKCQWAGKQLIVLDPWYPSSQLCSCCGYKNPEVKNLGIRHWKCPVCGEEHDRDANAAVNIRNQGLLQLA